MVPHPASLFLKAGAWPISRQVRWRVSAWWWASATTAEHTIPFRADEQRLSGDSSAWTARWNIHATDRGLGNHLKMQQVLLSRRNGDNYQSEEASVGNEVRLTVQLSAVRSRPAWKVICALWAQCPRGSWGGHFHWPLDGQSWCASESPRSLSRKILTAGWQWSFLICALPAYLWVCNIDFAWPMH